ncbi:MAG TPA: crosslink repair DNA glycosylase YcaQ family protein, partial [Candidatus Limnocylindrales bacterium]|nr:crosslink repair DNA glycosylase YcaQ family protein [Candidatus Limnocylindrales bacterium]
CTYVLPAGDFALGLTVGGAGDADVRIAEKLGATRNEIDALGEAVVAALASGPLEPDGLRALLGERVRDFGAEGRKRGLNTTLPVALGMLQAQGEIRRIPTNGRLDQQRYRYALWRPNPLANGPSRAEAFAALAERFFRWIGPATLAAFREFSGLGVKAANDAVAELDLQPLESGDDRLLLADERADWDAFTASDEPRYALVSSLDSLLALRRDLTVLLEPGDAAREAFSERGMRAVGDLRDLANHAIVDRGRLIGLWDYDVETGAIAWTAFVAADAALRDAVARTEAYVRDQLGDARSFSLDSAKSRTPRIAALRAAQPRR